MNLINNNFRTDLAIELQEISSKKLDGVSVSEKKFNNIKISKVNIETEEAGLKFGKPVGIYYTIELPSFRELSYLTDDEIKIISNKISKFFISDNDLVLVVGLGNRDITPDSVGPRTVSKIISTRHVKSDINFSDQFKNLRSVAAIAPGVLGQTGIEISEIIKSLVEKINPSVVILIDALVSQNINRLGSTIQISNSGISPGSGVMNPRKEISEKLLGVPIISIGIPTVVDAKTIINNITNNKINTEFLEQISPMIVTPKEIDNIIKHSSNILSLIINKALQSNLLIEDIKSLVF
ncbi:MAG: GPR endopeptidase [Oscillospiraceae bacterium]|nr:GPR endopeptidase [Oscillospiraceae bacterium]